MNKRAKNAITCASGIVAAFSMSAAFPALAFANEKKEGIAVILPDMNEFIPMLIAFIVLWVVLAKFGWPAFENMIQKRSDAIQADLKKAEDARVEGERVLAEYKAELEEAKAQASQIVADAKKTAEAAKADITAQAEAQAADMIEKARSAIESEKKAAIAELKGSVADTSVAVASRLIGADLSEADHRAIIERYVNEAGSFNGN